MKKKFLIIGVLLSGLLFTAGSQTVKVKPAKSNVVQSFDFGDVQFLPGLMYDEFREIKDYFMSLSNDDMLYGLRLKEGIPNPPGKAIGGWYELTLGTYSSPVDFILLQNVCCYRRGGL